MNPQDLNRYTYVLNNPIRLTDSSGHCPIADKEDECWVEYGNATKDLGFTPKGLADWETDALRNLNEWIQSGVRFTSNPTMWDPKTPVAAGIWTADALSEALRALGMVQSSLGTSKTRTALELNGGRFTINAVSNAPAPGWADQAGNRIHINVAGADVAYVVVHEIGHIVDWHVRETNSRWGWSNTATIWLDATGWIRNPTYGVWYYTDPTKMQVRPGGASSSYATERNPGEDFAETFVWRTIGRGFQPSKDRRDALDVALDRIR